MVPPRAIVHLTHTDPRHDSRILKEMYVGHELQRTAVIGIGIADGSPKASDQLPGISFRLIGGPGSDRARYKPLGLRIMNWLKGRAGHLWWPFEFSYKTKILLRKHPVESEIRLIHVHDFMFLLAGVRLKKTTGAALVYDAHELEAQRNGLTKRDSFFIRAWEHLLWKNIDGFITVSESIRQHYFDRHDPVPSAVVLNSPSPQRSTGAQNALVPIRKLLEISPENKLFVYLGYLYPGRGIELILEAFRQLPSSYHVAFVGSGELEPRIRSSPAFGTRIHLTEPVKPSEVVAFVSGADAGFCLIEPVSLSDYFSLPNKLFECLFAGIPVIGSPLPEIKHLLDKYDAGLTVPLETSAIMKASIAITARYFRIREGCPHELSWNSQSEKVAALYAELLGEL